MRRRREIRSDEAREEKKGGLGRDGKKRRRSVLIVSRCIILQ